LKKVILKSTGCIEVIDFQIPEPKDDEVLLRVLMVGICGTDVDVYRGLYEVNENIVLGHEYCAVVEKVGPKVRLDYKKGDYVASAASWGCGTCYWCLRGYASYCEFPFSLARTVDGVLAEYVVVPERILYHLREGISFEDGQGVVGVSTALRAAQRGKIAPGDNVLIVGPGYAGLLIAQICAIMGGSVTMVGTKQERLDKALSNGAENTVNVKMEPEWEKRLACEFKRGFDVCIEAAGVPSSLAACVNLCKKGGSVVEFGASHEPIGNISQREFYSREISIIGSKGGYGCYHQAIDLITSGKVSVEPLITHKLPLSDTAKAFEIMDKRLDKVIRAAVIC
jgi:2-desacetyl-2-hydroxyethyl bacteriochlorophyllide A dehydrogenase